MDSATAAQAGQTKTMAAQCAVHLHEKQNNIYHSTKHQQRHH
jgi:hypothetical protein